MKVICIASQKGGSGKTTTTSLIVKALSMQGHSVLALDLDPQGGLTSIFLGESDKLRTGIYDFIQLEPTEDCIHPTDGNLFDGKIDIVPSDYRTDKIFLQVSPFFLKPFKELNYDYMVIDTPPTVMGITRAGMVIADRILVPTEISIQSKAPTQYTLDAIKEVEKKGEVIFSGWKDPGEKDPKKPGGYQANLARDFHSTFKDDIAGVIPRNSSTVSFAMEWKKATAIHKQGILKAIDEILGTGEIPQLKG